MLDFLSYGFMQRALVAGIFVSVTCAVLGVFLVLKKDAMIGHGLSHVTFGGVALGLLLDVDPFYSALVVSVVSAVGILKLKERAGLHGDTGIGIVSSVGMAFGVLVASVAGNFNVDLFGYLFGSILAITSREVWVAVLLTGVVLSFVAFFYSRLLYVTFDPESAQVAGIKTKRINELLAVLTAMVVVVGMKIVGLLLVAALVVIPAAAALQVARTFWQAILISSVVAVCSLFFGLYLGFAWDWPVSGNIVMITSLFFLILFFVRQFRR